MLRSRFGRAGRAAEPLKIYWRVYGGVGALIFSPYFWTAVALTLICRRYWTKIDIFDGRKTIELSIAILPGLMAFSAGGMAILLAFSGDRFLKAIRQKGKDDSLFMKSVVSFFHFLFVQTLALCFALISKAYEDSDTLAGIAFFLLCYGIVSVTAAAAMLLNIARVFNIAED